MLMQLSLSLLILALFACLLWSLKNLKAVKAQKESLKIQLNAEVEQKRVAMDELLTLQQKVKDELLTDALTGLVSRKIFEDRLALTVNQALRHQLTCCVIALDLDGFKIINNALGYEKGDAVLKEIAQRLLLCIRQVDTVSRFNNDEFIFIFSQINKAETAAYLAQRLLETVAQPVELDEQNMHVTASIGIAVFPMDAGDAKTLLKNAFIALEQAKLHGHNNYQFFREEMHTSSMRELALTSSLRNEATTQKFLIKYQPQIDVTTHTVVCMDSLISWPNEEFGEISFEEITRLAEKNDCILAINEAVLRTLCHDILKWQKNSFTTQMVSIPVTLKQFENIHFVQKISSILQETHTEPSRIVFEIMESSLLTKVDSVEKILHMLKKLGLKIAVNNFGMNHLQLPHLRMLPIDIFKIDASLTSDITSNAESEAIAKIIISLAKNLKAVVVAEGVDNAQQKALLESLGCTIMQGNLFGAPALANDFDAKVSQF